MDVNTFHRKLNPKAYYPTIKRQFKNISDGFKGKLMTVFLALFCLLITLNALGQRHMEHLTRGLVAVKTPDYVFLSWRIFSTDGDSVQFNLYRNGTLVNTTPISGLSNYIDSSGIESSIYYLETIYGAAAIEISTPVTVWQEQYQTIHLQSPGEAYYPNDAIVADLDGDGEMEIIVKMQTSNPDNTSEQICDPLFLHAYKLNGTLLWSIDLGVNIRPGAHYLPFMVYDIDGDGMAEVACKTAPGVIDGTGTFLGKGPAATDDDGISYVNADGRILAGPEYLTVFEGLTGKEQSTVYYIPRRHPDTENPTGAQLDAIWGDSYGNRVDRFLACVAYFDSIPSLVMCRGYYTRTVLAAWDFKVDTLVQRWIFDTDDGFPEYEGQGNHNLCVADVDNDGKDEIIYGAMAIDDDGTGLWTTGLGHGDAMHVSDIDPDRPGLEKWGITEPSGTSGSQLLDAKTGEIIWGTPDGDIARGVSADVSADYYGMECWGGTDGLRSCKNEYVGNSPSSANFVIWWDDDLLRELLDGVTVSKYNTSGDIPLFSAEGCMSNNSTKSTPNFSGDIIGDWREEMVFRTLDNQALRIYTTTTPTEYGIFTLLQDPQYRLALVWQNVGYNQPPHPGFYLGHGMNLDSLPVPDIKVNQANTSSIQITSPVNSFELGLGLDLNIIVHAIGISDTNKTIIISNDITPLDTILSAPYYTSISGLTSGDYSLLASAYDLEGKLMISDTIHISVDEGYPHVTITSPLEGNTFLPDDSIPITINAYDTDGSIDSVAFYLNSNRLATLASTPYSVKIENPGIGIHELKVIAYDNDYKFTESEVIQVEVGVMKLIQETEIGYCGTSNGTSWIESNHPGYTGIGFVNTDNVLGVQIIWAVDFPESGLYKFEWRYASADDRPGQLLLNDIVVSEVPFINTGDWVTWETLSVNANVHAGINKIGLEAIVGSGLGNIDYLRIYSLESGEEVHGIVCDSIYSSDATLSDLSVIGKVLDPAFHKDTTKYSVTLDAGTTLIQIAATPSNANASVTGYGIVPVTAPHGSVEIIVTAENGTSSLTYTINYEIPVSIDKLSLSHGLKIYPVPAQNYIFIRLNDRTEVINDISIYSIDGRKIVSTSKIFTNPSRVDLPELKNGLYLINVNTNYKSYTIRFSVNSK